ncbi:hypothetical protein NG798_24485 [Ancylothrix sp. C2]|uniref:hypothetical protein n=1 Tax=Ancylothrix sp. D3o TaxID=2953691 RepID=UPI0021BB2BE6|nr:hypothetical protein [Ancylothrix sp. D3o]MCT7952960.1 hypothetical protein [Ancylothrix sp. D3o]
MEQINKSVLFPGCLGLGVEGQALQIRVKSWDEAWKLNQSYLPYLAALARLFGKDLVYLVHNTVGKPHIPILASMIETDCAENEHFKENCSTFLESFSLSNFNFNNQLEDKNMDTQKLTLEMVSEFIEREDCDGEIAALALGENEYATWIIDQKTQEVLLANRVALAANCKPPREILASNISALWEEEPLRQLTDLVYKDKAVREHTNTGYRWQKEEESGFWFRKPHFFTVDYAQVNFLGQICRFEIVKSAVPV